MGYSVGHRTFHVPIYVSNQRRLPYLTIPHYHIRSSQRLPALSIGTLWTSLAHDTCVYPRRGSESRSSFMLLRMLKGSRIPTAV